MVCLFNIHEGAVVKCKRLIQCCSSGGLMVKMNAYLTYQSIWNITTQCWIISLLCTSLGLIRFQWKISCSELFLGVSMFTAIKRRGQSTSDVWRPFKSMPGVRPENKVHEKIQLGGSSKRPRPTSVVCDGKEETDLYRLDEASSGQRQRQANLQSSGVGSRTRVREHRHAEAAQSI